MLLTQVGRLLECGEYKRCLEMASLLLKRGGLSPEATARTLAAVCRSRLELADYFGAVEAGQAAVVRAEEAERPDILGQVLVDMATALADLHQYDQAVVCFRRFLEGLPDYVSARCLEGIALLRMGRALHQLGRHREALDAYNQARRWFVRWGDSASVRETVKALIRLHLDRDDIEKATEMLAEGDRYAASHPEDRHFLSSHLLDRARCCLAAGRHTEAAQEAFLALETADGHLTRQSEAQLLLARIAAARDRSAEAIGFALASRISAIDGKLYLMELEAADLLLTLLRKYGRAPLKELEADFHQQRIDIYQYLPYHLALSTP